MRAFLKGCAKAFCVMAIIVYTSMLLFPQSASKDATTLESQRPTLVFLDILFAFFLYLLLRKKNHADVSQNTPSISPHLPEIPAGALKDMRKYYTASQIQNDMRIMQDSFKLIQQTIDFDTFFMRLELSRQKALTLLQAAQAGCKGIVDRRQMIDSCEAILSNIANIKIVFLDNSYKKETTSAMQLKTKSGQYKRLSAYLERLKSYENQFMDVEDAYTKTVAALRNLIAECQPSDKKLMSRTRAGSTADEIMKFKQLLDAGAITQEEYDLKKSQLLNQ